MPPPLRELCRPGTRASPRSWRCRGALGKGRCAPDAMREAGRRLQERPAHLASYGRSKIPSSYATICEQFPARASNRPAPSMPSPSPAPSAQATSPAVRDGPTTPDASRRSWPSWRSASLRTLSHQPAFPLCLLGLSQPSSTATTEPASPSHLKANPISRDRRCWRAVEATSASIAQSEHDAVITLQDCTYRLAL